jgi:DEAD/DEAH box helicase domain-containing protein
LGYAFGVLDVSYAHEGTLVEVPSIDGISVQGMQDSALEARFLGALRRLEVGGKPVTVESGIDDHRTGYVVRVGGRMWRLSPQVNYGRAEGLEIGVSADYVLHPMDPPTAGLRRRPIAVFLDGWRYHRDQTGHDLLQRQLLVASGRAWTWTLTWQDLDEVLLRDAAPPASALPLTPDAVRQAAAVAKAPHLGHLLDRPLLQVLADELAADRDADWPRFAGALVGLALGAAPPLPWSVATEGLLPAALAPIADEPVARAARFSDVQGVTVAAGVTGDRRVIAVLHLDDAWGDDDRHDRDRWRAALRAFQVLHALPDAWATAAASSTSDLVHLVRRREAMPRPGEKLGWAEEAARADLLDAEEAELAREIARSGVEIPEIGYDVVVGTRVVAEAVLAWPARRVAVLCRGDEGSRAEGWRMIPFEMARESGVLVGALG